MRIYLAHKKLIKKHGFDFTGVKCVFELFDNYCRNTPLCRMLDDEDLKGAIVFLASDASKYVTGQNMIVDEGFILW